MRARRSMASGEVVKRFLCDGCGFTSNARIRALGFGAGLTRGSAADDAAGELTGDALRTLDLIPCPRCGRRRRSLAGVLVSTALLSAVIAGAFWLAGFVAFRGDGAPRWLEIAAAAVVAAFAILRVRRALRAASRVELLE